MFSMEAAAMRSQPAKKRPDAYWPHNSSACGILRYLVTKATFPILLVLLRKKKCTLRFLRLYKINKNSITYLRSNASQ